MRLNVFCRDRGWLFEDFKGWFARSAPAGIEVVTSADPVEADRWLCLRTDDAHRSPDPSRTTVQYHDLAAHPRADAGLSHYRAVVFTHPEQPARLARAGCATPARVLLRPIGAPEWWRVRDALEDRFTVGWVGRAVRREKNVVAALEAVKRADFPTRLLLVGEGVAAFEAPGMEIEDHEREATPFEVYEDLYRRMDAVVLTSESEAGPMPLFEALACGVPVVSLGCGWSSLLIRSGFNGYVMGGGSAGLTAGLAAIAGDREAWLARAPAIRASLMGWTLEGWVRDCLEVAS